MRGRLSRWMPFLPLASIIGVGAVLRLIDLGALPPGLYRDEAWYGLDALGVLNGHPALYFAANNGREGAFIYLLAASIGLAGRSVWALRIVSALVGILTLFAAYAAGRAWATHRVGVLAAGVMAVTFWHVALSRVAFRAITLPLIACLALAACGLAWRARGVVRVRWAAVTGALFGAALYTYTSWPFLIGLGALLGLAAVLRMRGEVRAPLLAACIAALLVATPMLLWATRHPDLFLSRAGQVSILSPEISHGDPLGALLGNTLKALGMFTFVGDRIWRHNLPLRPVFDPVMGLAFGLGVVLAVFRALRGDRFGGLLLAWLAVFLIPTILAEDTPHALRAIGALPPACLLAALGLDAVAGFLAARPAARRIALFVPALVLAFGGWSTWTDYFDRYVRNPMTGFWLEAQNTALADGVNAALAAGLETRIDPRLSDDNPALRFLVPDLGSRVGGAGDGAWASSPGILFVDPNHPLGAFEASLPTGRVSLEVGPRAQGDLDPTTRIAWIALRVDPPTGPQSPHATFDSGLSLLTATKAVPQVGDSLTVSLTWRAEHPLAEDDAVFVHWLRAGAVIAQADEGPMRGYWPMPAWRIGDVYAEARTLMAPGGWQPGDVLRVGVYRRADLQRRMIVAGPAQGRDALDLP